MAHGYLVVSLAAGLFVGPDPGPVLAKQDGSSVAKYDVLTMVAKEWPA